MYSGDINKVTIKLKNPAGNEITILTTNASSNSSNKSVNITLRDQPGLYTPAGYVTASSNTLSNCYPFNYGYWKSEGSYSSFTGSNNGTWTLTIQYPGLSTSYARKYIRSELVFGDPFVTEDIKTTKPNKSCADRKCIQTGTVYLATNSSYPTGQGLSGFYNIDDCKWNNDDNAAAWFSFTASSSTVEMSISGMIKRLQSVVVKSSDCSHYSLVSGGCPSTMFTSSSSPNHTQYYNQSYSAGNGASQNHGYTLTDLTPGEEYILVIDGEDSNVSDFYLEIKSGADNGCCPNVTLNNTTTGSCVGTNNGSVTVSPAGGSSYTYDFGSGYGTSNSKNNIAPGTYSYTVKESSGCTYPGSYVIPSNPTPAAPSASDQSFCISGTVANLDPSGLTWYPVAAGGSALSGSTALANNTNYYASQIVSGCESARKKILVKIDTKPTKPTAISANPNTNVCHGTPIVLTATGGTLTGSSEYVWGTSANGSQLGTTDVNTLSQTPSSTTTYYVGVTANGSCPAQYLTTGVTVTLPTKTDRVAGNNEGATCYVSGTNPIHFYHSSGRYIGSINPQGRQGTLTMTSYINTWNSTIGNGDGTMYSCGSPGNESFRTAYMKRAFTIKKVGAVTAGTDMKVYFPFTQGEYNDLNARSTALSTTAGNTGGNPNDNVTSLANIITTKYDGSNENDNAVDNCSGGSSITLPQENSGSIGSVFSLNPAVTKNNAGTTEAINYAMFNVSDFSEFHFHGINNNSPLPITLTHFAGKCEKDGINISWMTATESNVNHYEIERSRNGLFWEKIASINAVGNSSTFNEYTYLDTYGYETLYYRLTSVDDNGERETFNPISVQCEIDKNTWNVFPVPAQNKATVTISSMQTNTSNDLLVITDLNGKLLYQSTVQIQQGINHYPIDLRNLSNGTYFIFLQNNKTYAPLKLSKIE